jgi:hypothetical protein
VVVSQFEFPAIVGSEFAGLSAAILSTNRGNQGGQETYSPDLVKG